MKIYKSKIVFDMYRMDNGKIDPSLGVDIYSISEDIDHVCRLEILRDRIMLFPSAPVVRPAGIVIEYGSAVNYRY